MKAKDLKPGRWYAVKDYWVSRMKLTDAAADYNKYGRLRSDSERRRGYNSTPGRVLMLDGNGTIKAVLPRQIVCLWTEQEKRNAEKAANDKAASKEQDRLWSEGQTKLRGMVRKLRALGMKKGTHYHCEADDVHDPDDVDGAITLTEAGVEWLVQR